VSESAVSQEEAKVAGGRIRRVIPVNARATIVLHHSIVALNRLVTAVPERLIRDMFR
jgi:hypothetical protein